MNSMYHSTICEKSSANHAHTQFHVRCDGEESGLLLVWFQRENYNDVTVSWFGLVGWIVMLYWCDTFFKSFNFILSECFSPSEDNKSVC